MRTEVPEGNWSKTLEVGQKRYQKATGRKPSKNDKRGTRRQLVENPRRRTEEVPEGNWSKTLKEGQKRYQKATGRKPSKKDRRGIRRLLVENPRRS
jgi:hypothetical protein